MFNEKYSYPFVCPICDARHTRGPVNGAGDYRCLGCGYCGTPSRMVVGVDLGAKDETVVAIGAKVAKELDTLRAAFGGTIVDDSFLGLSPLALEELRARTPFVGLPADWCDKSEAETYTEDRLVEIEARLETFDEVTLVETIDTLISDLRASRRRVKMLEAERGPGIKPPSGPITCDVGADYDD